MNRIAVLALLGVACVTDAWAQAWPSKVVRVVTGSVAGGGADVTGRPIVQRMSEMLKQQVIIDNRPGAAGLLANDLVAKSAPDGYTLLLTPGSFLIITSYLNARPPYNPQTVLTPIVQADVYNFVVVVHPSVPAKNAKELLAVAKARPGALTFVSSGVGSNFHLAGELFKLRGNVDMLHVSYKGSPQAIVDLMAGRADVMFVGIPAVMTHIKSGRLRAVGTTGLKRNPLFPEVPTVAESALPGYEITGWEGFFAPIGTPREIVNRVNAMVNEILQTPEMRELWASKGVDFVPNTVEQFAARVRDDYENTGKLIKAAGIRAEQ
ncbi:MAG: tripartite tricarboxylate transporter substrate binding protein [Betaproteobacteria bacterium]|nr:tripartite tricarboxylate transporter substrate binding protein [Betaproteobacteria bacterium]